MKDEYYNKWHSIFTKHTIPIMAGFGIFSWFQLFNWNLYLCIMFGLYATALVQKGYRRS